MSQLTPDEVHSTLAEYFPPKHDDLACTYIEELAELNEFGINTEYALRSLLSEHCEEVLEIDASPMSEFDIKMHKEVAGEESVNKRLAAGYWFSYPGLLRIALELEFGEAYIRFSEKRDGIKVEDRYDGQSEDNQ